MNTIINNNFVCIGQEGLGNTANTIAHSMAFFKGCIYVGTTNPASAGPDDSPRIMRYRPDAKEWQEVYRPPLVKADARATARDVQVSSHTNQLGGLLQRKKKTHDSRVTRDRGYRGMTVFKGKSDSEPVLYVTTLSPWGSLFLRSEDGEHFEVVSEPGLGNSEILSFRGLTIHQGKLFAAPAGTTNDDFMDRNFSPEVTIYVSDDPANGHWQLAVPPNFGDPDNGVIYSLAAANGFIYAGTGNAQRGFQIWKTQAQGTPPFDWQSVLIDGAYRYNFNMATAAMVEFKGALYVGGGIPGFGYDKTNDVGPAAAELIRIFPDNCWDLIFGTPRFTPDGFKVPLAAMGPGFDDPFNSVVWSMAVHRDVLYLGTHQWEPFQSLKNKDGNLRGGYQLWSSKDGEEWNPITLNAFGNPFATGLRTLLSTPYGLVAGTSNYKTLFQLLARFGGKAINSSSQGGLEIWLGQV